MGDVAVDGDTCAGGRRDVLALVNAGASRCHDRGDARVLLARLSRLLLSWQGYSCPAMSRGPLCVNLVTRGGRVGESLLQLSPLEFGVLAVLMHHYLRGLSRDGVLLRLYQDIPATGRHRVLDVIVGRLRKKLADHGMPVGLSTVWRVAGMSSIYVKCVRWPAAPVMHRWCPLSCPEKVAGGPGAG